MQIPIRSILNSREGKKQSSGLRNRLWDENVTEGTYVISDGEYIGTVLWHETSRRTVPVASC